MIIHASAEILAQVTMRSPVGKRGRKMSPMSQLDAREEFSAFADGVTNGMGI